MIHKKPAYASAVPAAGAALAAAAALAQPAAWADVTLPPLFSDHAVLLKAADVPVWGRARPGEKITVAVAGASAGTVAGADGRWKVSLDLSDRGQGPHEMVIGGDRKLVLKDILIGEVWLCSGQSNMEMSLSKTEGGDAEAARSANPWLRCFYVPHTASLDPQEDVKGTWRVASPETSGAFSAAGYYFGKRLQGELKAPVGLIQTAWGWTPIESWISLEALDRYP